MGGSRKVTTVKDRLATPTAQDYGTAGPERSGGLSRNGGLGDVLRHNLLVRVARLHYLYGLTHQEIADREGLSRIKVTRLLKEAAVRKIVEVTIRDPVVHSLELEEQLQETFGLKTGIIVPTPPEEEELYDILGRFAADFLMRHLRPNLNIGLGWGNTVNGMLPYLQQAQHPGINVISLTGGLAANRRQPNPYDVVSATAQKLAAAPHYPLVPALVENEEAKTLLLRESKMQEILSMWKTIDMALMSIGVISADKGFYYSFPNPETEAQRVRGLGAVGDLLGTPYDQSGRFVDADFMKRTILIDFRDLKRTPVVVGIAGGSHKVEAILGALRGGYLNTLITDESTARAVIEHNSRRG